jgi:hypothetical protein
MSGQNDPDLTPEQIERITDKILLDISGIRDRQQRSFALGSKLKKLPSSTVLEIFHLIAERAQLKIDKYEDGFRTISDVKRISQYLGLMKMSEIYTLARQKDYGVVVRFMSSVPPARKLGHDEEIDEDLLLKEMSLGLKRQKARMRDRDLIDRLCHEQDPVTIMHLLKNPVVTIREIIKITSKRPTSGEILRIVYKDLKWMNHYSVKKSLVNNPYTPTQISLSLLHFLLEQDLEDVAEAMLLHPVVREQAEHLIMTRRNAAKGIDISEK